MNKKEEGAIVVEASIAVPVYIFIIFTILSIINICYAQAKMQVAINSAARQLSELSYVLYATNVIEANNKTPGKSSATAEEIGTQLKGILEQWDIESDSLNEMAEMIGTTSLSKVVRNTYARTAMKTMINREFKTSKSGDSASLKKWLKINNMNVNATISDNDVLVVGVYYEIEVIKLLNIDFKFQFHSGTMTFMWTNCKDRTPSVGSKGN